MFSHWSAAIVDDLPLIGKPARIHAVADRAGGGRSDARLQRHCIGVAIPTVVVDFLEVTSLAATAAQVASVAPFGEGLVVADAAVRLDPAGIEEVCATLGRRGRSRALRVFELADPLSETPGESVSRASIHLAGLPRPVLQAVF